MGRPYLKGVVYQFWTNLISGSIINYGSFINCKETTEWDSRPMDISDILM